MYGPKPQKVIIDLGVPANVRPQFHKTVMYITLIFNSFTSAG